MLNDRDLHRITGHDIKGPILALDWKTQDSTEDSLLFYKIAKGQEALFLERIAKAKFRWLILNQACANAPQNSSVINESEWPKLQKALCDVLYPIPKKIKLVGITGTNGKTTTTDLVLQVGHLMDKKGFSVGTLGVREYNRQILDFGLTSPPLIDLRKYLHKFGSDKDFCVMEASSHALEQGRLEGITFDCAGWLSFSQDHLDYHKTMESYFKAKALIFTHLKPGARLYAPKEQTELLKKLQQTSIYTEGAKEISGELPLFFKTRFNQNNLEVAKSICTALYGESVIDLKQLIAPDGRFYIRSYGTSYIVVDFAHTPDALENVCHGIRETFPQHKLKVLFGCGGDRDRTKRPLMAEAVEKWAHEIYVTSDNPRSEDPQAIIQDILKGIHCKPFKAIVERPAAVKKAFSELKDKEVLLLAGKGHEDYILINGVKHPYSDIGQVNDFLAGKKA